MDGYTVHQLADHERRLAALERRVKALSHSRDRIIVDGPITVHGEHVEDAYIVGGGPPGEGDPPTPTKGLYGGRAGD